MSRVRASIGTPAGLLDLDGTYMRPQICYLYVRRLVERGLLSATLFASVTPHLQAYRERRAPFHAFIDAYVSAYNANGSLKGLRVADAVSVAEEVATEYGQLTHVFPREFALAAHEIGMPIGIISGSATEVVAEMAKLLHAVDFLGTEWEQKDGVFTGGPQVEWCMKKDEASRVVAERNGWDLCETTAMGDTSGDAPMFSSVGYPICVNPDRKLLKLAREKHWPIVFEKKNVHVIVCSGKDGLLHETSLDKIMPYEIANALYRRLQLVNW